MASELDVTNQQHYNQPNLPIHLPMNIQRSLLNSYGNKFMLGPFWNGDLELAVQISCFGVIPKGHTPGKQQLILDLSYPEGASVNDGISQELCSINT